MLQQKRLGRTALFILISLGVFLSASTCGQDPFFPHPPPGQALFASPQVNPIVLSHDGAHVFVANTTSHSVSVIDTLSQSVVREFAVGIDPVSLAVRPDGSELWVANHISDSISIVDLTPPNPGSWRVTATLQELNGVGATRMDEPVGIAFADDTKAYVALSSRNDIAVVDVATRSITSRLHITAQDPRAIAVRGGKLFVAAFESGNQTEVSACPAAVSGGMSGSAPQCTFGAFEILDFVTQPNLAGIDKNIVVDPDVPDRDLFVFDTATDTLIESVEGVGTLLYGLSVDSSGNVFVSHTDARNAVNGLEGDTLSDLDNRMFENRVARVDCGGGGSCVITDLFDLEPGFPGGTKLATPYGIRISDDDLVLVGTAAASNRIFSLDPTTGVVRDSAVVGSIPRGIALASNATTGAPETAWVLDTLGNTVSVVDVSDPDALVVGASIPVGDDPTPEATRRGRIAFNAASASTSGTFACASCHPDAHTDQLLWRIGGGCFFGACSGDIDPRTTMPIRGLANTLPLHWDGTLGDPFGGPNGAIGAGGSEPANCSDDHSCFLHLVDASLSGVMCDQTGSCPSGGTTLTLSERNDIATFLASVSYPPARSRTLTDEIFDPPILPSAARGFKKFFTDQGGNTGNPDTCADSDAGCHELPLLASTNSSTLEGFDAPSMRGMTDRFVQFSLAPTSAEEVLRFANTGVPGLIPPSVVPYLPADGLEELVVFAAAHLVFTPTYATGPQDTFQMFEEMSTGTSGATGRQVTLDSDTLSPAKQAATLALLDDLEAADAAGLINLRGEGVRDSRGQPFPVVISYRASDGLYRVAPERIEAGSWQVHNGALARSRIESEASSGLLAVTLTAYLPENFGKDSHPQPLIWPAVVGSGVTGDPAIPHLVGSAVMSLDSQDVRADSQLLVDGSPVAGSVVCAGGSFSPFCSSGSIDVTLSAGLPAAGLRRLQIQNELGPLSNELPFCVGSNVSLCTD